MTWEETISDTRISDNWADFANAAEGKDPGVGAEHVVTLEGENQPYTATSTVTVGN